MTRTVSAGIGRQCRQAALIEATPTLSPGSLEVDASNLVEHVVVLLAAGGEEPLQLIHLNDLLHLVLQHLGIAAPTCITGSGTRPFSMRLHHQTAPMDASCCTAGTSRLQHLSVNPHQASCIFLQYLLQRGKGDFTWALASFAVVGSKWSCSLHWPPCACPAAGHRAAKHGESAHGAQSMPTWTPTNALLHAHLLPGLPKLPLLLGHASRLPKLPLLLGHASRLPKLALLPHSLPWLAHAWPWLGATCSRRMQSQGYCSA